jgi:hypothetical protein
MTLLVAIGGTSLVAARTTAAFVAALCLDCSTTSVAMLRLSPTTVWSWAVSRNVTAANRRAMITAASAWMLAATAARGMLPTASGSLLSKRRKRQNQKNCKQTR